MSYNFTNLTNSGNFESLLSFPNDMTYGIFGMMLLIGLFIVSFTVLIGSTRSTSKALVFSSWLSSFMGIVLFMWGLLDGWLVIITIVFTALIMVVTFVVRN